MSNTTDTTVAATIFVSDRPNVAFMRCGNCDQRLPDLWNSGRDHMLVQLGIVKHLDLVLSRSSGWTWGDGAWRLTKHHREQRQKWESIAATPGHCRAAEVQDWLQQPYGFAQAPNPISDADVADANEARFWGKAGIHLALPTVIECPASACGTLNVIDAANAPRL